MNEPEEDERCAKHKLISDAICLSCNNMKCCYKCFSISNQHFNHNSLFLKETDSVSSANWEIIEESSSSQSPSIFNQEQPQKQQKEKKRVLNRQIIRKESNSNQINNQMKNYRTQIDDLCKQITEQVWNYRQKFIQYMDSKLREYNAFILVEQGSQITTEMISMRNELESFINSLKNQIKSIDSQNGQKQSVNQLVPCNCSSAGANCFNQNVNNNFNSNIGTNSINNFTITTSNTNNNSNNNAQYMNVNDDDSSIFSHPSPSICSCSCPSSSSYTSSPSSSSFSCSSSSPYYYNHACLGGMYCQQNQQSQQKHNEYYYPPAAQAYPTNSLNVLQNKQNQTQSMMGDSFQHLTSCPNFQLLQKYNAGQKQTIQQLQTSSQPIPRQISQIFIILTNGKSLPLLFNIYSSVLQVKILIFEKTGVPPLEQKLFFYTKELHNYTVMKDYSIPRDCSIKLYIRSFYSQLQSISKQTSICSTALPQSFSLNQQSNFFSNQTQQSPALPFQKSSKQNFNNTNSMINEFNPNFNHQALPELNTSESSSSQYHHNIMMQDYDVEIDSSTSNTLPLHQIMENSNTCDKNKMQDDNSMSYQFNQNNFICS